MLVDLHGITLDCLSSDPTIQDRWARSFSSRPQTFGMPADVTFRLERVTHVAGAPAGTPVFTQGDLLAVYVAGPRVDIHLPRFGRLQIDLDASRVDGQIVRAGLETYGVFEDVVAMGLS